MILVICIIHIIHHGDVYLIIAVTAIKCDISTMKELNEVFGKHWNNGKLLLINESMSNGGDYLLMAILENATRLRWWWSHFYFQADYMYGEKI